MTGGGGSAPRVLLTRAARQGDRLAADLVSAGYELVYLPTVQYTELRGAELDAVFVRLKDFDRVALSSPRAVEVWERRLREAGSSLAEGPPIAAVGRGTARRLADFGVSAHIVATKADAGGLAAALIDDLAAVNSAAVLHPGNKDRRPELGQALSSAGINYLALPLYQGHPRLEVRAELDAALGAGPVHALLVTSAKSMEALVNEDGSLPSAPYVAIGPATALAMQELGIPAPVHAEAPTAAAVLRVLRALSAMCLFLICAAPAWGVEQQAPPAEVQATALHAQPFGVIGAEHDEHTVFEAAMSAYNWGNLDLAQQLWEHYLADFPSGGRWRSARFNAGLAAEGLGRFRAALEHYQLLVFAEMEGEQDQGFVFKLLRRRLNCLVELGSYNEALAELDALGPSIRDDELSILRARALTGVGRYEHTEQVLRALLGRLRRTSLPDRRIAASASFYLAEQYRLRAQAIQLNKVDDLQQVGELLDKKAEHTVAAQDLYLDTMSQGYPDLVARAGYHLGRLYEEFHHAMQQAPMPTELDSEQQAAYRLELNEQTRVLLDKARTVYKRVVELQAWAELPQQWVQKIDAALQALASSVQEQIPVTSD